MWLKLLALIIALVVILRPLRTLFLRHATFTIPALFGALIGLAVANWLRANAPNIPAWIVPLHMLAGAVVVGEGVHRWLGRLAD